MFSSLSESGFIPTYGFKVDVGMAPVSSHLFQRVASFLLNYAAKRIADCIDEFSSLSESGFIPTRFFSKKAK